MRKGFSEDDLNLDFPLGLSKHRICSEMVGVGVGGGSQAPACPQRAQCPLFLFHCSYLLHIQNQSRFLFSRVSSAS